MKILKYFKFGLNFDLHCIRLKHLMAMNYINYNGTPKVQNIRCGLTLHLRENPIPILALREGALPETQYLPSYIKYNNPNLLTFTQGSTIL